MVDEEAKIIREEVIRALAQQEEGAASVSGDTDVSDGFVADAPVGESAANGLVLPNDAQVAAELQAVGVAEDSRAEADLLAAVFDDVRAQSAESQLVQPVRWPLLGLVPAEQTPEEWEMYVYEYLEQRAAECKVEAVQAAPIRTATRSVGVPRILRRSEDDLVAVQADSSEAQATPVQNSGAFEGEAANSNTGVAVNTEFSLGCDGDRPAGDISEPASEPASDNNRPADDTAEPVAESACDNNQPACNDIVTLVGKHSYYLYSNEHMTDAYARWAFLAAEDDRMLTFVECVRGESRTYPRPMGATSLMNEPFNLKACEVDGLWQAIRDSGMYPDLDTVAASNGDVYYFSTEYLSPTYAASLAEWNSVERDMFL